MKLSGFSDGIWSSSIGSHQTGLKEIAFDFVDDYFRVYNNYDVSIPGREYFCTSPRQTEPNPNTACMDLAIKKDI